MNSALRKTISACLSVLIAAGSVTALASQSDDNIGIFSARAGETEDETYENCTHFSYGEDVMGKFNADTGKLTIYGSGPIVNGEHYYDGSYHIESVWNAVASDIVTVEICEGVTSIDEYSFYNCYNIVEISIPSTVENIAKNAFAYCSKLTEINVKEGNMHYSSIDGVLFSADKTTLILCPEGKSGEYTVPGGVREIAEEAFRNSSISKLNISEDMEILHSSAFRDCYMLTEVNILSGLNSIVDDEFRSLFEGCYNLSKITVDAKNEYFSSLGGILYNKDKTVLFRCPAGKCGEVNIPEGVETIADSAFYNCKNITGVTFPATLKKIDHCAFIYCESISELLLPDGLNEIGGQAFYGCSKLKSINLPDGIVDFGGGIIADTEYYNNEENWDNGVLYIDNYLVDVKDSFEGELIIKTGTKYIECLSLEAITSVSIPATVENIDAFFGWDSMPLLEEIVVNEDNKNYSSMDGVLYNVDKTEIIRVPCTKTGVFEIPDSVISIGDAAFFDCDKLDKIVIPSSVKTLGEACFACCTGLGDVVLPDGLKSIPAYAFYYSDITSVIIPEGVTEIGGMAFNVCFELNSVVLPRSLKTIYGGAFTGCNKLDKIIMHSGITEISNKFIFEGEEETVDPFDCIFDRVDIEATDEDGNTLVVHPNDLTVYGEKGSYIETYAKEHNLIFITLNDDEKTTTEVETTTEKQDIDTDTTETTTEDTDNEDNKFVSLVHKVLDALLKIFPFLTNFLKTIFGEIAK